MATDLPGTVRVDASTRLAIPSVDWSGRWTAGDVIVLTRDVGTPLFLCLGNFPAGPKNVPAFAVPLCEYYFGDSVAGASAGLLAGWSPYSSSTLVHTLAASGPVGVRAPAFVHATGGTVTIRLLSPFDDGGSPILNFEVYKRNASSVSARLAEVVTYAPDTLWTAARLSAASMYSFSVVALNTPTLCLSQRTESAPTHAYTTAVSLPVSPASLRSDTVTGGSISVVFSAPADDGGTQILRYEGVFNQTCLEEAVNIARSTMRVVYSGSELSFTVYGLAPATPYCLKVRAVTAFGVGDFSNLLTPATGLKSLPSERAVCSVTKCADAVWLCVVRFY